MVAALILTCAVSTTVSFVCIEFLNAGLTVSLAFLFAVLTHVAAGAIFIRLIPLPGQASRASLELPYARKLANQG